MKSDTLIITSDIVLKLSECIINFRASKDFSRILVLFPNKRPAYYLLKQISKQLKSAYIPPVIFTLNEFVNNIATKLQPLRLVNGPDKVWILFETLKKIRMDLFNSCFSEFYLWGVKLSDAIDEIEMGGVDDKKLVNLTLSDIPHQLHQITSNLHTLRKEFYSELKSRGFTTQAMNFRVIATEKFPSEMLLKSYDSIYLCGFYKPLYLEEVVLEKLNSLPCAVTITKPQQDNFNDISKIHIYSAFDTHSQVKKIREILSDGFEPSKTVVVLTQAESLLPFLSEVISRFNIPYNVSMGYPLTRTPLYAFIETIIKLQEGRKDNKYRVKDYLALILHPYLKSILTRGIISENTYLENKISESISKKVFITLEELESEFNENNILPEIHKRFIKAFEDLTTFEKLSEQLTAIFQFILKSQDREPSEYSLLNRRLFEKFFTIFEDMKKLLFKDYIMEPKAIFSLFRYYIAVESPITLPFPKDALDGLQILGMLETRNLNFEKVIIMDVIEGVMPSLSKYDPILPSGIRKFLGLPGYKERELIFKKNFVSLLNSAKEVHLIYKKHSKDVRSRYIEEIIWEKQKRLKNLKDESCIVTPVRCLLEIKDVERRYPVVKSEGVVNLLRTISYSPSSIDTYLSCPARFYYSTVLGLEDKERNKEAAQIGRCVHSILNEFLARYKGRELKITDSEVEYFKRVIDKKIEEFFGETAGEVYLFAAVAKDRLFNFLDYEKTRDFCVEILDTEKELHGKFRLKNGEEIELLGRVDRIDRRKDNYCLIDYKTQGYKKPSNNLTDALDTRAQMKKFIKSFQLPIYTYLFKKNYPSVEYNNIKAIFYNMQDIKEEEIFSGVSMEKLMSDIFLPSLANLLEEILNPEVCFEKDSDDEEYCSNCPYWVMCASGKS